MYRLIKTPQEIKLIKESGKILSEILDAIILKIKPNVSTAMLEDLACELIQVAGGRPSFKNYKQDRADKPFPTALCLSVNDQIVHGPALPERILHDGDIVGVDIGMEFPFVPGKQGYYSDMAKTVAIGKVNQKIKKLINTTEICLKKGIEKVKPGNNLNDIGRAIQDYAEKNGFNVVRDLVGHGVGLAAHEDPDVPNYYINNSEFNNFILKPGMVIAIEPMVNMGGFKIKQGKDGISFVTTDGSLSAHFEHTVIVTETGCDIATI
jgi:methionyl aminopeptidase